MSPQVVYFLVVCFGASSWVTVNGIFSVLPLIIDQVPEGWAIASTLALAIQAANVGPLGYHFCCHKSKHIPIVVDGILSLGALSMLVLASFWNATVDIAGQPCSIILIACTFTAALCDCTSSVVYWPFIGKFAPVMVAGLALGENLSGVVASAVSWLALSPSASFCSFGLLLMVSGLAFHRLLQASIEPKLLDVDLIEPLNAESIDPLVPYLVVGLMSLFENAVLPGVLPYATARYSQTDYHIASTIPVGPMALFTLIRFQAPRPMLACMVAGVVCGVSVILWIGLGGMEVSNIFAVTIVVLTRGLIVYIKATSMYQLRVGASSSQDAQRQLETAGAMMQAWSLGGAIAMFALTHYTAVFPQRH